jgi:hypothetical protein
MPNQPTKIKRKNKVTVWLSDETLDAIGNRKPSGVINQTLQRVAIAGKLMAISQTEIEAAKLAEHNHCGKYPDQRKVVADFALLAGRSIPEAIAVLDKIEREGVEND